MKREDLKRVIASLVALAGVSIAAEQPATRPAATRPATTQPADPTLDWLMSQATTTPTVAPAVKPTTRGDGSPFLTNQDDGRRPGTLLLSDGETIHGRFATTKDKPVRVWDAEEKEYRDIPFDLIQSFEARILWERDQPEWHFKASGSDIKEFTGKTYPAREMEYIVTLINGQSVTGGVVIPLYLQGIGGDKLIVLNKRSKGDVGQKLEKLVYVKRLDFDVNGPTTQP